MKQINLTIQVPENKLEILMEFLNKNFVDFQINKNESYELPEWQKSQLDSILREHNENKTNYSSWEKTKADLTKKYNL